MDPDPNTAFKKDMDLDSVVQKDAFLLKICYAKSSLIFVSFLSYLFKIKIVI